MRFPFRPFPACLRSVVGGFIFLLILPVGSVPAQSPKLSPGETVLQFYRLLREKKYIEAFRLHVCAPAVETMSSEEAAGLQDEFEKVAGEIPEKIELGGESVLGNDATVFVKVPSGEKINGQQPFLSVPVGLILFEGKWLIGDRDTQALAFFHKNKFFSLSQSGVFTVMLDNEEKAGKAITALIEIEQFFTQQHNGKFGTFREILDSKVVVRPDLVRLMEQLQDGEYFGYRFEVEMPEDRRTYTLYATPIQQNIDGRYSYIADREGGVKFRNYGGQKLAKTTPGLKPLVETETTTVTTLPKKPQ
jgi:hypothetical protein